MEEQTQTQTKEIQELKSQLEVHQRYRLAQDRTEYRMANLEVMETIARQLHSLNRQIFSFNELYAKTNKITTANEEQPEKEQKDVPKLDAGD